MTLKATDTDLQKMSSTDTSRNTNIRHRHEDNLPMPERPHPGLENDAKAWEYVNNIEPRDHLSTFSRDSQFLDN